MRGFRFVFARTGWQQAEPDIHSLPFRPGVRVSFIDLIAQLSPVLRVFISFKKGPALPRLLSPSILLPSLLLSPVSLLPDIPILPHPLPFTHIDLKALTINSFTHFAHSLSSSFAYLSFCLTLSHTHTPQTWILENSGSPVIWSTQVSWPR